MFSMSREFMTCNDTGGKGWSTKSKQSLSGVPFFDLPAPEAAHVSSAGSSLVRILRARARACVCIYRCSKTPANLDMVTGKAIGSV